MESSTLYTLKYYAWYLRWYTLKYMANVNHNMLKYWCTSDLILLMTLEHYSAPFQSFALLKLFFFNYNTLHVYAHMIYEHYCYLLYSTLFFFNFRMAILLSPRRTVKDGWLPSLPSSLLLASLLSYCFYSFCCQGRTCK